MSKPEQIASGKVQIDRTHRLEMLDRIGSAIASNSDLESIVQIVTDAATELVGAQSGAFFYNMVDGKGESHLLYSLSGALRSEHVSLQTADAAVHEASMVDDFAVRDLKPARRQYEDD